MNQENTTAASRIPLARPWGAFALLALAAVGLSLWQENMHPLAWLALAWLPLLTLPTSDVKRALGITSAGALMFTALAWYANVARWALPFILLTPPLARWYLHRATLGWRQSQQRVQARDDFVHIVLSALGHGLLVLDLDGRVISANERWNDLAIAATPPLPQALVGQPYLRLLTEYAQRHQHSALQRLLERLGGVITGTFDTVQEELPFDASTLHLTVRPLSFHNQHVLVLTLTDISERHALLQSLHNATEQEKLRYQSTHDAMTGLHNRAYFEEVCATLQASAVPVGVVVVDLDGLKAANDTYGHEAGDELIKRAAHVLQTSFRKNDIVVRLGGDEFIVLLPNTTPDIVQKAMYRLRQHIRQHNEETKHPIPLSMSIGGAFARTGALLEAAIKRADELMYEDKRRRKAGRDSFGTP